MTTLFFELMESYLAGIVCKAEVCLPDTATLCVALDDRELLAWWDDDFLGQRGWVFCAFEYDYDGDTWTEVLTVLPTTSHEIRQLVGWVDADAIPEIFEDEEDWSDPTTRIETGSK